MGGAWQTDAEELESNWGLGAGSLPQAHPQGLFPECPQGLLPAQSVTLRRLSETEV